MQFDNTVKYICIQHKTLMTLYAYEGFRKRNIDPQRIIKKLNEVYGENFDGHQFLEFGEKYMNEYLIKKYGIDFNEFMIESFQPILYRFKHLA